MIVDIQFNSGTNDWPQLRDAVQRAELEGYATTWVFDHFDGGMIRGDRPMLECFTLLGALAASTSTIGLGTMVANVVNRDPNVLAAAASSVQRISGGRLLLGLGAGAAPGSKWAREHERRGIVLQAQIEDRHAAVARQIDVIRETFAVPVIVGVNSTALAHLAGRMADGINVRMAARSAPELIAAARAAAGDRRFDVSGWADCADDRARDRAEQLELDRLVLVNFGSLP